MLSIDHMSVVACIESRSWRRPGGKTIPYNSCASGTGSEDGFWSRCRNSKTFLFRSASRFARAILHLVPHLHCLEIIFKRLILLFQAIIDPADVYQCPAFPCMLRCCAEYRQSFKIAKGLSGQSLQITFQHKGEEKMVQGSHILVATGRTPNIEEIGLELAGVELTEHGYIKVDERLKTTADDVWANGEVAGTPHFTHMAFDDFRILRDNFSGAHRVTTGRQVPFCLFTDPELARIGLSESEAKARGIPYRLFKIPMSSVLRTRTLSEMRGFMKALVGEDDRILGFTVLGVGGGEIMSAVQIAMIGDLPYTTVRDAILSHPTLMEGLIVLFSSTPVSIKA